MDHVEQQPYPISFFNAEDVIEFDERCVVPRHIDGRKKIDAESWILGRYLRALSAAGSLTYPLTATYAKQSESPDFMLTVPGGVQIGLEVTEASTPETHCRYIESERSEGKAISGGDIAIGDAPERQWAAIVCERICTKAGGLASGRWTPAESYDLVLYENGPTSVGVNLPQALVYLHTLLKAQPRSGFRTVSIIADSFSRLVYLEGDCRTLRIPLKQT
jgi:hypothetical protein